MNHTEIEALLADAFPAVTPARLVGKRGQWSLPPADGGTRLSISVDDGWASLQAKADRAGLDVALDALSSQSGWPGGVKVGEAGGRPILRSDVPLMLDTSAGRAWAVRQLCASRDGMLLAAGQAACAKESRLDSGISTDPELVAIACSAGGWNAVVKPDGTVRIDLQIRGAQRSVWLQPGDAGIRASVALAAGALTRASAPCRAAAGLLLIRASAALRWARAFARGENGQLDCAGFECFIATPPDERAFLLAVDTVIAACELFGREAEVLLEHPEIACRYMEHTRIARDSREDSISTGAAAPRAAALAPAAHAAIA